MNRHPLSAVFGDMPKAELQQLADDIKAHGLREPVIVYQEQVLDGWHRFRACEMAGILPTLKNLSASDDPVAFVSSKNLHRRSLTASQRAAIVVKLHDWAKSGFNQHSAEGRNPVPTLPATEKQMAVEAAVSDRTIRQAKAAVQNGHAEAVIAGEISAKEAAKKPGAPQKPKPPTAAEKAQKEADALRSRLKSIEHKQSELIAELEAATAAVDAEDEQLQKFQLLTRKVFTLQGLLDVEREKSSAFLKENKWLRSELKKMGWQG